MTEDAAIEEFAEVVAEFSFLHEARRKRKDSVNETFIIPLLSIVFILFVFKG